MNYKFGERVTFEGMSGVYIGTSTVSRTSVLVQVDEKHNRGWDRCPEDVVGYFFNDIALCNRITIFNLYKRLWWADLEGLSREA